MIFNTKIGVLLTFCDLRLQNTFQVWIAPKSLDNGH